MLRLISPADDSNLGVLLGLELQRVFKCSHFLRGALYSLHAFIVLRGDSEDNTGHFLAESESALTEGNTIL